jgi:tetratricopeptide (TPR) repeat protein
VLTNQNLKKYTGSKVFIFGSNMGRFKFFVHTLFIATSPTLFVYPQSPSVQQIMPETFDCGFSYDDVLHLLDEISNGALEKCCNEQELDRINQFIAHLAIEGKLPTDSEEELENDIAQLLHVFNNSYEYALSIGPDGEMYAYFTPSGEVILCGWISKKWKETKEFCKKHKKTILIGTAVVVGAATVILTAGATTGTAVAAVGAAAASASDHHHDSKHTIATPQIKSAVETQIATFKETLITEGHLNSELPIEENIRTLGSLFAHQSTQDLQQQLANSSELAHEFEPMRWYNNSFPAQFGHAGIDQKFSTDYAPLYIAAQPDFNTLAYQACGEKALTCGYYNQAVHDFGKVLELNPDNSLVYLERGVAHFNLGQYDHSLSDYQHYIAQKPTFKESFSLPSFTVGFAKGLPNGIYDSGEGTLLFLTDLIQHPIHTSEQVWNSLIILKDLVKTQAWETITETLSPQVHNLVVNWDMLSSYERGELAGYAFGRHGTDFLLPAAAAKAAKTCRELAAVSKNLQIAEKTLLLETASSIPNGAKIMEANKYTLALAEDLGMSTSKASQLKRAGTLEKSQAAIIEQFTPEMRQSYELFQSAQKFLKPYSKTYITEAAARDFIHQTGVKTFPRPTGIPDTYRVKLSNTGAGIKYVHPEHEHISIRVMPGKSHSPYPHQQKPYVIQMKDGKAFNIKGELINHDLPEAHIPLEKFIYKE